MTTLYGISNCDSVKKAMKWLEKQNIEFTFHDFRKDGCSETLIEEFFNANDWTTIVNKRSTTFRALPDDVKNSLDENLAKALIKEQPTLIKRPIIKRNNHYLVGFSEASALSLFEL